MSRPAEATEPSSNTHALRETVLAGALFFVLAALTIHLTTPGEIATVWPANAVILAVVMRRMPAAWPSALAAGFLANLLASLVMRGALAEAMLFSTANLAEIIVAAAGIRMNGRKLRNPATIFRFILWTGILAPATSAVIGGSVASMVYGNDFLSSVATWFVADALGLIVVTPFMLSLFRGDYLAEYRRRNSRQRLEAAILLALTAGICGVIFSLKMPLLFLVMMPVLLVTARLGWLGTKLAVMIVAAIGMVTTMHQTGPVALISSDPAFQASFFQFFLACLLIGSMPLAMALLSSKELAAMHRDSERSLRLLATQSRALLLQFDNDGICRKILGASEALLGDRAAELIGNGFTTLSDESHAMLLRAHRAALTGGDNVRSEEFRLDAEGQRWFEAIFSPLVDENDCRVGTVASLNDITKRHNQTMALTRSAITDSLTGQLNRRGFMARLDEALTIRPPQALALAMIDVDRFKLINDSLGHLVGDAVLREIAVRIAHEVRGLDVVARLGGDEFVLLLLGADDRTARRICDRIVRSIAESPVCLPNGGAIGAEISCGLAQHELGQSRDAFLSAADQALYAAKRTGRNRLVAA
ncbi:MAG TPA: diguanylate cyclase [Novosphingobium sp.]